MTHSLWTYAPFADRAGKVSWIKLAAFVGCCAPAAWMAWRSGAAMLGPQPPADVVVGVLRQTGDWSIRFLVATLAITPLRYATRFNGVYLIRRMLGLTALFYALAHLGCWFAHEGFEWQAILRESMLRAHLLAGYVALFIMLALGLTSNEAAIRRLGAPAWKSLHWWIHPAVLASLIHYFMLMRLEATHGALLAGLCALFVGFRILRARVRDIEPTSLALLAVAAFAATAAVEAGSSAFAGGDDAQRLLWAHLEFKSQVRPAWWVLCVGLMLALARGASRRVERGRPRTRARSGRAAPAPS
jgi:sulfoxide reductase heme-binding subunit YedZ